MQKRGLVIAGLMLIFAVLMIGFASAAENETGESVNVDKAYKCLREQVEKAGTGLSLQDAVFAMLAMGSDKANIKQKIESEKSSTETCWPKDGCKIKDTAQVFFAYERVKRGSSEIKKWLLGRNYTTTDINWYLEIDITNKLSASCNVKYDNAEHKIRISEDMKLSGSGGVCLSIGANGYMLKINTNCIGKEFTISCDQDFVTSTVYQKAAGGITYVMPETHSASSSGTTKESVNSQCFRTGSACDYEGSLWAALAFQKAGNDITPLIPYLMANADSNKRYFPSAFLYMLVGGDDQYNMITQSQSQGKFWQLAGSPYNKYYDTSLAMLALSGKGAVEFDSAKEYLLGIQTEDGCWNNNNIKDTGFVLYTSWSKSVTSDAGSTPTPCEPTFSCAKSVLECRDAGGIYEMQYECPSGLICCSKEVEDLTCEEKRGVACEIDEDCVGGTRASASDSDNCCIEGSCQPKAVLEDKCTLAGGVCKISCDEYETMGMESCESTDEVCCFAPKASRLWIWITLLVILIGATTAGIIYRNKLRLWWAKFWPKIKEKFKRKKVVAPPTMARPAPMPMARPPMMPSRMPSGMVRPPVGVRPISSRDKEMEETLRKLKEMSK